MHNDVTRLDAREESQKLEAQNSYRPGKLNNSKWPLSKFSRAMTTKTSIPRGHLDLMHNDVTRLDAREECWS